MGVACYGHSQWCSKRKKEGGHITGSNTGAKKTDVTERLRIAQRDVVVLPKTRGVSEIGGKCEIDLGRK